MKWTIITVVGVALFMVALALVIYGVVTHKEAGLLEVCWSPVGEAQYTNPQDSDRRVTGGSCERPEKLVWPAEQIPLTVAATTDYNAVLAVGSAPRRALDEAIRDVNRQVGFFLLRASSDAVSASVLAQLGTAMGPSRGGGGETVLGWARHYLDVDGVGAPVRCEMFVLPTAASLRERYLVSHHELLHCVGLAHDDFESSAMYPLTEDDVWNGLRRSTRISDHDVRLLRSRYN